jgi:hypothetical protein
MHAEPVTAEPVEAKPAQAPVQSKVDPRESLADTGLVMVETRSKPAEAQPEEPEQRGRPRRERPTPSASDGEMVQIETTRKP